MSEAVVLCVNSSPPGQNGRHFTNNIFRCIFENERVGILILLILIFINRNSYIFIQENPFENVVWKMAAILSRPQCVKASR